MRFARYYHGILHYAPTDYVYVFGGGKLHAGGDTVAHPAVQTCEKFGPAQSPTNQWDPWRDLSNMLQARSFFNPCLFHNLVYLCGFGSTAIEAFSPMTEAFTLLPVNHPESSSCCLYVCDDKLIVHSENYLAEYRGQGNMLVADSCKRIAPAGRFPCSQPVVLDGVVFICRNGKCVSFDVRSGSQLFEVA